MMTQRSDKGADGFVPHQKMPPAIKSILIFLGKQESQFFTPTQDTNGFAASLEEEVAPEIAKHPKVLSVFENNGRKLHTTRSRGFIGLEDNYGVISSNSIWNKARLWGDFILDLILADAPEQESIGIHERKIVVDGVLIANELIDDAKRRSRNVILFKADFEKAYDSINWQYLQYMMEKMCFCDKWRRWIDECLRSATVSVLVNRSPTKEFKVERGLRQGDPFFPFLFLVVAEGLGMMMNKVVEKQENLKVINSEIITLKCPIYNLLKTLCRWGLVQLKSKLPQEQPEKTTYMGSGYSADEGEIVIVQKTTFMNGRAPSGIIYKLESLFMQFLWGGSEKSSRINWVKWSKYSAYKVLNGVKGEGEEFQSMKVWNKAIPSKVSVFAWQVMQNRVSTKDNLGLCRQGRASFRTLWSFGLQASGAFERQEMKGFSKIKKWISNRSWNWQRNKASKFIYDWSQWWLNPLACLGAEDNSH
ncbi:hypothetical protein TSUD_414970 [Trifolium subterraneum]|uniref:Reverse transcriptase domain-containing protein n=1 Tax=Trifolium subterraneum TaxID=3900 RepID=A0A2Z6P9J1_TRISU|nr:hypothetical protein TSUD_414970 [Trifolium subterraneum]